MTTPESGAKKGHKKARSKKMSTRVDLTAMVDLGFLLITFFMLATTFNKPKTMEVNKPIDDPNAKPPEIPKSKTLTLLLGDNDKIYWYVAPDQIDNDHPLTLDSVDYSSTGIRKVIQQRQDEVSKLPKNYSKEDLFVMLKPLPKSKLKNTVDILDEMTINNIKYYALVAPNDPVDSLVAIQIGQQLK